MQNRRATKTPNETSTNIARNPATDETCVAVSKGFLTVGMTEAQTEKLDHKSQGKNHLLIECSHVYIDPSIQCIVMAINNNNNENMEGAHYRWQQSKSDVY